MKTSKNIFIAFILNLGFSIFEFIGGAVTGSVAIISDAVHDIGDAMSIGISYLLERKSKKKPDDQFSYGYIRYSIVGSVITTVILLLSSVAVIYNAICRIFQPVEINYDGMIIFAIVGAVVNFIAAWFTREGDSLNQKAVNLHMLEDVIGWCVVLIGAIIMRFTDISILDPLMSIAVAVFILYNAIKNLKEVLDLFLEKVPKEIDLEELRHHLCEIEGVQDVHHLHIWSIDGYRHSATMHIVTDGDTQQIKQLVRTELAEHHIVHCTLEIENTDEVCAEQCCHMDFEKNAGHHHHHHHHH